jgi:hypothetical protein
MKTILEGNKMIKDAVEKGIPYIAGKMGAVEQQVMIYQLMNKPWDDSLRWHASNHAGITPPTDRILEFFSKVYMESLLNTDLLTIWFPDNVNSNEFAISNKFCPNAEFIAGLQALEPFYHPEPWSAALKDKKVLVIHPFEESLKEQFNKKHLLFEDKTILPDFEMINLKSYQTHGGGNTDMPWDECYNSMVDTINNTNFDVALVGCGAYGLPLCDTVKKLGKPAIHVGGGLQIMFGIKGNRWDNMPPVSKYYNEHWKRPYDSEKTRNHQVVEGSTYW